jgi:hypothetical protein
VNAQDGGKPALGAGAACGGEEASMRLPACALTQPATGE